MNDRKPKVGEVWTSGFNQWECVRDLADGTYLWLVSSSCNTYGAVEDERGLTPPAPERKVVHGLLVERRAPRVGEPFLTPAGSVDVAMFKFTDELEVIVGVA